MKTFVVDVQRVSYSRFVSIKVQAETPEHAVQLALDEAGDHEYSEAEAEYNVDFTVEAI